MAEKKAANGQVKAFGMRMAQDHGKANEELPERKVWRCRPRWRARTCATEKLSGADFDREYLKHMVADHKKDISAFEKQAKSGKDADLKAFAAKTLPTLQEHSKLAQATYNMVRKGK